MVKKESNVVIGDESQPVNVEKNPFSGKSTRIDGKVTDPKKQKIIEDVKEEYDPRKHRIPNGVRRKIIKEEFVGKSQAIGQSKKLETKPMLRK